MVNSVKSGSGGESALICPVALPLPALPELSVANRAVRAVRRIVLVRCQCRAGR